MKCNSLQTSRSWICSRRGSSNLNLRITILSLSSCNHIHTIKAELLIKYSSEWFYDCKLTLFESLTLIKACDCILMSWTDIRDSCLELFTGRALWITMKYSAHVPNLANTEKNPSITNVPKSPLCFHGGKHDQ